MKYTRADLIPRGLKLPSDDASAYSAARNVIVEQACATLLKKDTTTQNMVGRYLDDKFSDYGLDIPSTYGLTQKDEREAFATSMWDHLGWKKKGKNKLEFNRDRLDEISCVIALASHLGSVPDGPGDITMNSFRYYDVLKLIMGENFDLGGNFELKEDTPSMTRFMRFRYFEFIAAELKLYVRDHDHESVVGSLYIMQLYQLMPCLAAAFCLKQKREDWTSIQVGYPVISPSSWTDNERNTIELLDRTKVKSTPEWVKIIPLIDDETEFLDSKIGTAVMLLPFANNGYDEPEYTKSYKWIGVAPYWNGSILEYYSDKGVQWVNALMGMTEFLDDEVYRISFETSIKGYYLGEANLKKYPGSKPGDPDLQPPDTLKLLYDDAISTAISLMIKDSSQHMTAPNLLKDLGDDKMIRNSSYMEKVIKRAEDDIFSPVLNYTERRFKLAAQLKLMNKSLPLYYKFQGDQLAFTVGEKE